MVLAIALAEIKRNCKTLLDKNTSYNLTTSKGVSIVALLNMPSKNLITSFKTDQSRFSPPGMDGAYLNPKTSPSWIR